MSEPSSLRRLSTWVDAIAVGVLIYVFATLYFSLLPKQAARVDVLVMGIAAAVSSVMVQAVRFKVSNRIRWRP